MFSWLSKNKRNTKKVFVGVSGGVDSSVAAALLQDQGYDVTGVFIRTWQPDFIACTWRDERRDAMRVCAHLGIPFVELDLEQEYKQGVADYMIAEYKKGRTPNPDVMCNREVKFGGFLQWALKNGADAIATGHYAQILPCSESRLRAGLSFAQLASKKSPSEDSDVELCKGSDSSKDQSYFLWTLTLDQLPHVLFPVGHLPKSEVRTLAQKYRLPTAVKKDSQGICFIGEIDMKDFLAHYIPQHPGNVINDASNIIGHHNGSLYFTLGERHGFTITEKGTDDKPYYVVAKDIINNTLTVSQNPQVKKHDTKVILDNCVWRGLLEQKKYTAQIRYHGTLHQVSIHQTGSDTAQIVFDNPDYTMTSGQSVVIYDGDVCKGGGVIH